jgi:phosphoglycolate phosphatase
MHRLIIFDFDGVLADSAPWFVGVLNSLADRHRFRRVDAAEIETLRGLGNREIMQRLGVSRWRLPWIAADMKTRMSRDIAAIKLFDGVGAMLTALDEAGLRLGIVSSNDEANVRAVLGPALTARIDDFDCGAGLFGKPAHLRRVMKRASVSPDQTLCIGDEPRDGEAAAKVGAAFGAVAWGYATPESLARQNPAFTFETMADIATALTPAGQHP